MEFSIKVSQDESAVPTVDWNFVRSHSGLYRIVDNESDKDLRFLTLESSGETRSLIFINPATDEFETAHPSYWKKSKFALCVGETINITLKGS